MRTVKADKDKPRISSRLNHFWATVRLVGAILAVVGAAIIENHSDLNLPEWVGVATTVAGAVAAVQAQMTRSGE